MTLSTSTSAAPQNPNPRPPQPPRSRRFKFLRVTSALIMREIASTESRTSLGFLWQLIEPVATTIIMTIVFQTLANKPPLGENFPLFYVTGVMPYQMFQTIMSRVSSSVKFSKPLLEFPTVSIFDALMARFILNFVIECAIFVILTAFTVYMFGLRLHPDVPLVCASLVLAAALGLGIGTFNSVLFVAWPVYEMAFGILVRPLMLISGVMFLVEAMPDSVRGVLMWNPVAQPVALMRAAFYPGAVTSYVSPMYLIILSLVTFAIGLVTLQSFFRDALER